MLSLRMVEFDPLVVAAAVGATASLAALAATNMMSFIENRKKRYVDIVVPQTIEHKNTAKNLAGQILALTHPLLLVEPKISATKLLEHKVELLHACSAFELTIRMGTEDSEENSDHMCMHNSLRNLVTTFFEVVADKQEVSLLEEKHADFREVMSAFDSASWRFSKRQVSGKNRKSFFHDIFVSKLDCVRNSEKPVSWINDDEPEIK